MTIGERLRVLREKSGFTLEHVGDRLGIMKQSVHKYESGVVTNIPIKYIEEMAQLYDSTPAYIMGWEDRPSSLIHFKKPPITFPHDTIEVAEAYTDLPDNSSKNVIRAALRLKELQEDTPEEYVEEEDDDRDPIPLSILPASAGNGSDLEYNDYEMIKPGPDVPRSANAAVPISGDSMEPEYPDGHLAWVRRLPCIDIGEIGAFILNGEGYIKELGDGELISLNPEYPPIELCEGDELITYGLVVGVSEEEYY